MNFLKQHVMGIFLSLALAFTLCVVVFVAPHSNKGEEGNTATHSSPQQRPAKGAKTPTTKPVPAPDVDHSCEKIMSATVYQDFVTRVLDYEQVQLSPDSPAKESQLTQFATQKYLEDHPVVVDPTSPTSGSGITVSVDSEKSQVSCVEAPDEKTRYISILAVFETERNGAIVNGPLTAPLHATAWIEEDNVWKANQEQ